MKLSSNYLNSSAAAFIPFEYFNLEMISISEKERGVGCE